MVPDCSGIPWTDAARVCAVALPAAFPRIPRIRFSRIPIDSVQAAHLASIGLVRRSFRGTPAVRIALWRDFAAFCAAPCPPPRSCKLEEVSLWACGAAGSALPWHGRGRRFDPDQVHQTVFGLLRSINYSQQSQNIPAKWVPFAPKGHRRGFSAY
jgi:hypothetical protein